MTADTTKSLGQREALERIRALAIDLHEYADACIEARQWGGPTIPPRHPVTEQRAHQDAKALDAILATLPDPILAARVGEAEAARQSAEARVEALERAIRNPPKHDYWRPGEPDRPADIKAPNGELWKLRCRRCGQDNPKNEICLAAVPQPEPAEDRP